jgi:hypothetical protein
MSLMKEVDQAASAVTVRVPLAIKSRGGRKVVASLDRQSVVAQIRPRIDNTLLRAVIQAFHWKSQLEGGQYATVSELAAAEGLNGSYVSHVLRWTLLAPDLVEGIIEGQQNMIRLQLLIRNSADCWMEQRKLCSTH